LLWVTACEDKSHLFGYKNGMPVYLIMVFLFADFHILLLKLSVLIKPGLPLILSEK
jgi:hypothetical protein